MANSESRQPQGSEVSTTADVGAEKKQVEQSAAARAAAAPTDYDGREQGISEERKPMGPPMQEGGPEAAAALRESERDDEPPVDPA